MAEKKGKVWGTTQQLFKSGATEVHYIEVKDGGYCSRHRHQTRTNQFFVISGRLAVAIWEAKDQIDITILEAGEQTTVPIGQDHMFMALEDSKAIEIYEARCMAEDIDRKWQGGMISQYILPRTEQQIRQAIYTIETDKAIR